MEGSGDGVEGDSEVGEDLTGDNEDTVVMAEVEDNVEGAVVVLSLRWHHREHFGGLLYNRGMVTRRKRRYPRRQVSRVEEGEAHDTLL